MSEPRKTLRSGNDVMDINGCADYLGISPDTLYHYAATGTIPAFKLGNRWRFQRGALIQWMDKQSETESREQGKETD